jgi:transposase-like protein
VDGEIVVERRRQWTPAEKAALLREIGATGGRVSVVAQRHGIARACCTIGDRPARRRAAPLRGQRDLSSSLGVVAEKLIPRSGQTIEEKTRGILPRVSWNIRG